MELEGDEIWIHYSAPGRSLSINPCARSVHFQDDIQLRLVGSSTKSLDIEFVFLAYQSYGLLWCSSQKGIQPWALKPYVTLRRSVHGRAIVYAEVLTTLVRR